MLTGKALIRIFVSFFPFPSAPLMITAEKLLVVIDYGRSTSSDWHINLFQFRVDGTGTRNKTPTGASSSLSAGKIHQTNKPYNSHVFNSNVTLVNNNNSYPTTKHNTHLSPIVAYDRVTDPVSMCNATHTTFYYRIGYKIPMSLTSFTIT